jgi:hypothetical protein
LFDCGEVVVSDVVAGKGTFHGDLVDVVSLGGAGDRWRRCGSVSMSSQASGGGQPRAAAWAWAASAAARCSLVIRGGRLFHSRS